MNRNDFSRYRARFPTRALGAGSGIRCLAVLAAALSTGVTGSTAAAEWDADASRAALEALGVRGPAPSEPTLRRVAEAVPAGIAAIPRRHWAIENEFYWIRDVALGEDASHVRIGTGPAVLAMIRNVPISLAHLADTHQIAAWLRHNARRYSRPTGLLNAAQHFAGALAAQVTSDPIGVPRTGVSLVRRTYELVEDLIGKSGGRRVGSERKTGVRRP